jgi:glycosyltransferase involved in cell wall biosynthesis
LISVLLPAYNAEPYIATALDSLLSQRCDLEIVICDDGSTDGTREVAFAYAKVDSRVLILSQPNAGAAAARNRAFKHAKGDWIIFFDADDFLAPGSLAAMREIAARNPGDGVFAPWTKFLRSPDVAIGGKPLIERDFSGSRWLELAFQLDEPTYPGRFLFPRGVIESFGGWDERLSFQDDMEFFARVIARIPVMRHCPTALFCYRQGVKGSISNTHNKRNSESCMLATDLAVRHLLAAKNSRGTRHAAVRQLMLVAHATYLSEPNISREAERRAKDISASTFDRPWLKGGLTRRILQSLFGWKTALCLHNWLRYRMPQILVIIKHSSFVD